MQGLILTRLCVCILLIQLAIGFKIELILGPSEAAFTSSSFLASLASRLNNMNPTRLSVVKQPETLKSGHRVLEVRVAEGTDHRLLKKKVMMLPFGHHDIDGFQDLQVKVVEETPGVDGAGPAAPPPPVPQIFTLGCMMDTPVASFDSTGTLALLEARLHLPEGSLMQKQLRNTVEPQAAFDGVNVMIQSAKGADSARQITVIYEMHSDDNHLLDTAVMKVADLPWVIPHVVAVGAGVVRDGDPPPPPDNGVPEGTPCGATTKELCVAVVVDPQTTIYQMSDILWTSKLAHIFRIHPNRVRYVSHGDVTPHPSWADVQIDKEYAEGQKGKMVLYAMGEGDPSLVDVHGKMLTHLFHAAELMRVSAGFQEPARRSLRLTDGYL